VDLIDNDDVDIPGYDIGQEPLEGRAVKRAAREAAVVVPLCNQGPAFCPLARDVGLAGLPLGIERVEVHVEAFFAGLAGVNRATQFAGPPAWFGIGANTVGTAALASAWSHFRA